MIHQPPSGARDLLPLDVAQKRWIEKRLRPVFAQWGYHRIITSTVERLDTLMAGGAIDPSTVIQLLDSEEEIRLGLRPELTASIARTAVARMGGTTYPQRLYYNANVFRRAPASSYGSQQEFYQAGVELLGVGGLVADGEILLLLADCLSSLGVANWRVILGEAGLTASLLSVFPPTLRKKVRLAIAHLDRIAIETLPLTPEQRDRATFLFDLRGRPQDILQQVGTLELDPYQQQSLENLKSLIDLLQESGFPTQSLILDLSLIQTLDYYTGIVFEVVSDSPTGQQILGQGGRYDQLLALYHPQGEIIPGIGFALNIEDLHQVLLPTGQMPMQTAPSHWLVVPVNASSIPASFAHAQKLRKTADVSDKIRVEVYLRQGAEVDQARTYAQEKGIKQIAWVNSNGEPEIENLM
ncbi:ATP phosphoribosyltransferase regulatory subunit [[Phormidium] sp. ETS-05]|uniref:ATP phosphoribosyltransferase regulatory subunit n=1 Tax=[Phormidium] sp. ETS-05 TaxID=222819 RepID=UPI0018EEE8C2|nr:ATP phosphoribosyltransferase regulatory subunit [[Phormidium] sp. ETS-05]